MGVEFNLQGLKKRIEGIQAASEQTAVNIVNDLSEIGARQARELAPVDSGELRESIHEGVGLAEKLEEGTIMGGYRSNSDHAVFLEYGTGHPGESGAVKNGQPKDPDASVTYTQKDYWRYQDNAGNWRTSHGQPAQPYMYPSALAVEQATPDVLEKRGKELLEGGVPIA